MSIHYLKSFKDLLVKLCQEGRSLKSLAVKFGLQKILLLFWFGHNQRSVKDVKRCQAIR